MSTSSSSSECGACRKLFTDPRMLKCLHTFCLECLKKLSEEQGTSIFLKCPTCEKAASLPNGGLDALPKDLRKSNEAKLAEYRQKLDHLVAPRSSGEVEAVRCERCVDENVAVSFCCQCCRLLCEPCSSDHKRSKATVSHRLIRSPRKTAGSSPRSPGSSQSAKEETDFSCTDGVVEQECLFPLFDPQMVNTEPQVCGVHKDEVLKFYCDSCSCLVCRDCTIVEHAGHSYNRMEKVVDRERGKLNSLLDEANQTKERVEAAISSVVEVKRSFSEKKRSIDESIASVFHDLEQSLSKRKEALLAKSAELSGDKVDRLGHQVEEMDKLKSEVVHVVTVMQAAVETYSVEEILSISSVLASRLKELLAHLSKLSLCPCETKLTPIFASLDPQPVHSLLAEFGLITSGCCPPESTASLQIPRAILGRERQLIITARDQEGKTYTHRGVDVQANVTVDGKSTQLEIIDNDNGTYLVKFVPESCKEHSLDITIQGQAIKGSPFRVQVRKPRDYKTLVYYEKCLNLSGTPWMVGVSDRRELLVGVGGAHCISIFDSEGYHLRSVGKKGSGHRQFSSPSGVVAHGDAMYVSEFFNHRIQKLTLLGDYRLTFGRHGSADGELNGPRGLCFDVVSKLLFVSDSGNNRISVFHLDGTFAYQIIGKTSDKSLIENPWGLAFDPLGHLHIVCYGARCVKVFTVEGRYLTQYGHGKMIGPAGIAVDEEGYSFVSEYSGHLCRVLVFSAEHNIVHTIENFASPSGVALDREGRLYVADHGNSRVLKY